MKRKANKNFENMSQMKGKVINKFSSAERLVDIMDSCQSLDIHNFLSCSFFVCCYREGVPLSGHFRDFRYDALLLTVVVSLVVFE